MEQTWRWFGPADPVPLAHIRQAGATGIVSSLHHIPAGETWTDAEVMKRLHEIEAAGLRWSVVESIPVPESIKLRRGDFQAAIDTWKQSLTACARAGLEVVCYNFMPIVDWTRTDLMWQRPSSGYALRFDMVEFVAYDIFVLERPGAAGSYPKELVAKAEAYYATITQDDRERLENTIIAGLPGTDISQDRNSVRRLIAEYDDVSPDKLAENLTLFLQEVAPIAQSEGIRLGIHPDDPPFSLFGLPRVVSTASDLRRILDTVPVAANGLTLCVGSLGSRGDNDLVSMVEEFGSRIHFTHLRNVTREPDGSFFESDHLDGSFDMVRVIGALMDQEKQRRGQGRADAEIPMRPDHGHLLADDVDKRTNPGYSYVGRLKGLAELRGVMHGIGAS